MLSEFPVLIAWRLDTSTTNSCWAANWAASTDRLSSRAKNRSFVLRHVGAKVVGDVDGALVGSDVLGASVGLLVGLAVGLAVGPAVASQHVTGQTTDISSAVVGEVHQPRLRKSWHGVFGSSVPAHDGAAVGLGVTGETDGASEAVGELVGEQVTPQHDRAHAVSKFTSAEQHSPWAAIGRQNASPRVSGAEHDGDAVG